MKRMFFFFFFQKGDFDEKGGMASSLWRLLRG